MLLKLPPVQFKEGRTGSGYILSYLTPRLIRGISLSLSVERAYAPTHPLQFREDQVSIVSHIYHMALVAYLGERLYYVNGLVLVAEGGVEVDG